MGRDHRFDGSVGSLGSDPFGLVGILEASGKALAVDPGLESDETLMAAAVAVDVARSTLEATEARILSRLEVSGATDAECGMRTGGWLAWETDTNPTKCRARVSTARRLGWFTEFSEALTDGRVGFAHAEVLASVANPRNRDGLREVQDVLIELAGRYRFTQWSSLVHQLADDLDQDGSFNPNDDPDRNRLKLVDNRDGTMAVKGFLNGTTAVTVTQGLETLADELFRRYSKDHEHDPDLVVPSRPRLLAEALAEALRRAAAVELGSTKQPTVEATIIIEHDPEGDLFDDLENMTGPRQDPNIACRDLTGRIIPMSTAEMLLTDPNVRGLLLNGDGVPLHLGDKVRFATPGQKHALAVRDGGCIFPGCDMPPSWCDAHHQPAWKPNGSTDIDKMYLACRRHHGVTHRKNWTCEPDPDRPQQWTWTTPNGHQLHSQRQHRRPD